jgi:hypothetical protein
MNNAFFVLSSGRCGTQTLAKLLDPATNAIVWHHPEPDPIDEAREAWHHGIDRAETFWRIRGPVIRQAWSQDMIHGETDMLITPFADAIVEEIPKARFIVLVRNPWAFVRSGMRRGYYVGHGWDHGRLCPADDDSLIDAWREWEPFEKVCWLWNETYRRIDDMTGHISANRVRTVRFEDLVRRPEICRELYVFLGLEGYDSDHVERVLAVKHNQQIGGDFPGPEEWSGAQHRTLWRLCRDTMERLGYVSGV